jgi:hypothetical protein
MSDDDEFYQEKNLHSVLPPYFGMNHRRDFGISKKYSKLPLCKLSIVNLAAMDCFATIEGTTSPYLKTY